MKSRLNMDKIAKGLGANREGRIAAAGGYFGARQVLADVVGRFRVPKRGGRATNPRWTERRLVPLAPQTLRWLEKISADLEVREGVRVEPMQVAGVLLERTARELGLEEAERLVSPKP
jgi:hypothetical protein